MRGGLEGVTGVESVQERRGGGNYKLGAVQ